MAEPALSERTFVSNYEEMSEAGSEVPKTAKTLPPTLTFYRETVYQLIERPNPMASANAAVAMQLMTNHHLVTVTDKLGSADPKKPRGLDDNALLTKIDVHLSDISKNLRKQDLTRKEEEKDRRALTASISDLAAAIRVSTSAGKLLLNQQQFTAPRKEAPSP